MRENTNTDYSTLEEVFVLAIVLVIVIATLWFGKPLIKEAV